MHSWEIPSQKSSSIKEPYDVGILLGGAIKYYNTEMERIVYSSGADRFIQTIELYKEGKIKRVLISGGSGLLVSQQYKESDLLKKILLKMSFPEEDIIIENDSKNTYENAKLSAEILKKDFPGKKKLLITSAFHMRRSLACFKKQGLSPHPYAVDARLGSRRYTPDKIIIPDTECLMLWDVLFHEWIGFISYSAIRFMGVFIILSCRFGASCRTKNN